MKSQIMLMMGFALLASGCAVSGAEGVYAVDTEHDAGPPGDPGANNGSGGEGMEASVCVVKGAAAFTGSFPSGAFAAQDAIEVFDSTKAKFTFLMTDYASACSLASGIHAGSNVVSISYENTVLKSGDYDVAKTAGLTVTYVHYDAACKASTTVAAESGTVTFDRLDDCGGVGSFDLVFGGAHVTSTFTASVCSVPSGAGTCH